jgi:hypothetical protein
MNQSSSTTLMFGIKCITGKHEAKYGSEKENNDCGKSYLVTFVCRKTEKCKYKNVLPVFLLIFLGVA